MIAQRKNRWGRVLGVLFALALAALLVGVTPASALADDKPKPKKSDPKSPSKADPKAEEKAKDGEKAKQEDKPKFKKAVPPAKRPTRSNSGKTPAKRAAGPKPAERKADPNVKKKIHEALKERSGKEDPRTAPTQRTDNPRSRQREDEERRSRAGRKVEPQIRKPIEEPDVREEEDVPPTAPGSDALEQALRDLVAQDPELVDPSESDVPPEERTYGFSIKDGTYEQLIEGFARQTGLGVIGEPPSGKVTFVTTEELDFTEAISRIRMLLFNYKPHEPYWLRYSGEYLRVKRVVDLYRELEPWQMFRTVEDFKASGLPAEELAFVIYTPTAGSVSDLEHIRDFMPDYVRIAAIENRNALSIFALVSDITKYLEFVDFFTNGANQDPRPLVVIPVEYITPTDAVERLGKLMDLDQSAPSKSRGRGKKDGVLDGIPELPVDLLPDDAQGVIIVRAMQNKIDEINMLLPYVDVDTSEKWVPVVLQVEHADVVELVDMISQIMAASKGSLQSSTASKSSKSKRRQSSRKAKGNTESPVVSQEATMIPKPATNTIIVIGEDEDVQLIRDLVKKFDVDSQMAPFRVELEFISAGAAVSHVSQLLPGGKDEKTAVKMVPEDGGGAIWLSGPKRAVKLAEELIASIDIEGESASWHIATLVNQKPSFVANMLREADSSGSGAGATPAKKSKKSKSKRSSPVSASKFTADDDTGRLYVLCTDDEWVDQYFPMIQQLEAEADNEELARITVQHLDPAEAINKIEALVDLGDVRFVAGNGVILASGLTDSKRARVEEVLAEIDVELELIQKTFEIKYVEPTELVGIINSLVGDKKVTRSSRRVSSKGKKGKDDSPSAVTSLGDNLTIMQLGDSLVVRTTPKKMDQVAELISQFDVDRDTQDLRTYEFSPGANVERISSTLTQLLGSSRPNPRKSSKGGGAAVTTVQGAKFIPQPSAHKLLVWAEEDMFPEIEELLDVLREEDKSEIIEWAFIDIEHRDPSEIVEMIEPLLLFKIKRLVEEGQLDESAVEDSPKPAPKGRRASSSQSGASSGLHMVADSRNSRIVIAAPQIVIDEARSLAASFDVEPAGGDRILKTVPLENAESSEVVAAVGKLMDMPAQRSTGSRRPTKGKRGAKDSASSAGTDSFTIIEAPGGGAVVLNGTVEDVAEAEVYIAELDGNAAGKQIKVYDSIDADLDKLAELILNVVDTPAVKGGKRPARPRRAAAEEEDFWSTTKTHVGTDIYLQTDEIAMTLLAAAPASKLARIDEIVAMAQVPEEEGGIGLQAEAAMPMLIYPLEYAEAFDASFNLESLLGVVWQPQDKLPSVDYFSFDNTLIVKYPDQSRFSEIEDLIVKYIDKKGEGHEKVTKTVPLPGGATATELLMLLKQQNPDINLEVLQLSGESEENYGIEEIKPVSRANPCVMPLSLTRSIDAMLAAAVAQAKDPGEDEPKKEAEEDEQDTPEDENEDESSDQLSKTADLLLSDPDDDGSDDGDSPESGIAPIVVAGGSDFGGEASPRRGFEGEVVRVVVDENTGSMVLEGPKALVEDLQRSLGTISQELSKLPAKPDIRVIRVRYIDVNEAASILDEMFNAARRQAQQAKKQADAARKRAEANRRKEAAAKKRAGDDKNQPKQPQPQEEAQPEIIAQVPGGIQILPVPSSRTLIIKANTADYAAIYELLATIDQPQPLDYEMKIIQIKKLNAADVEDAINNMLGLGAGRSTASSAGNKSRGGSARRTTSSGKPLPRPIMQETVAGELGVFKDDITISSDTTTNSLLVMAPPAAIELVKELVDLLESNDAPERLTRHYEFTYADVTEVSDYLTSYFEGATGRSGNKGRPRGSSSGALNAPTFLPYPRLNKLTVQATEEQIETLGELIATLDVAKEGGEFEAVNLGSSDARAVAEKLTTMFGGEQRGRHGSSSGIAPKFIGDEGGSLLFFSAPTSMREEILATIAEIEEKAKGRTKPRIIELEYALPSSVAEAIDLAYGQGGRGGRRGRSTGRFQITGHDSSQRLFVITPDDQTFEEIQSLAKTLDKPRELDFQFRIYPLVHADARAVLEMMNKLMTDYVRRMPGGSRMTEAFSVDVDDKSNSLIVLGGPAVFGFLEENLLKIDIPANAKSEMGFLRVILEQGSAQEVAANITKLWNQRNLRPGESAPQAEANRSLNMLIVRGTKKQLDEIQKEFIDPLKEYVAPTLNTETFTLKFAQPEAVADSINAIFSARADAIRRIGRQGGASPLEYTVVATPDVNTKQVIVQANAANMEVVRSRIEELDKEEVAASGATFPRTYPIKYADINAVVRIINDWAAGRTTSRGRRVTVSTRDMVRAIAEPGTQSVVVTASEPNHLIIEGLIQELDNEELAQGERATKLIVLQHADANEVADQFTRIYRTIKRRRGDSGPSFVADMKSNGILATVNDKELGNITTLLESLDVESRQDTERSIEVYNIQYADPNAVVNAINQTFRWNRRTTPKPEDLVTAVVDWSTQSIIVTASKKNHAKIVDLITRVDDEKMATGQRKRYLLKLENANAAEVARQLTTVFRHTSKIRRGDPGPSFVSDLKTNTIIANLIEAEYTEIQELITSLDSVPSELGRTMKVYPIKFADPNGVVSAINQTYRWNRRSQSRPEEEVAAIVDWGTSSVVVTASQDNHDKIQDLIDQLDREDLATGKRDQFVFKLKHASVDEVVNQFNALFRHAKRQKRGDVGPSFVADSKGNSLIARLTEDEHKNVVELLESLDVEPDLNTQRATVPYPVKYSDPGSINSVILNMFRWDRRSRMSPAEQVTSAIDWGTRSVIVTASHKNHEVISKMIEQVDVESTTEKEMFVRKLEYANSDDVARSLQNVYRGRRKTGRGEQPVQIASDSQSNSLLITANQGEMAELEQLIEALDVKPEAARQRQMLSYKLTYGDPWTVQEAINRLFRATSRNPRDQVTAVPEWGSNSVIVSASHENHERIEALITQMDSLDSGQRTVRVLNIENADPSSVARALNDIYVRSAQRSRGGEQPITISEIAGSKSILVKANEADMAKITETLKELDKEAFDVAEEIRIVQLLKSDASEMMEVIQEYLRRPGSSGGRRGGRRGGGGSAGDLAGDVRISVLTQANALAVSGETSEVDRIEAVIKEIDDSTEGMMPEVIQLDYADAGLILPTLEQMFTQDTRGRGGRQNRSSQPAPVIMANEALNWLIVRAGPTDMAAIKDMVARLDTEDAEQGPLLRIIRVAQGINITDLAEKLQTQFDEVARASSGSSGNSRGRRGSSSTKSITITPDLRTHSLLVSGSVTLADQVEEVVRELEKLGPPCGKAIRVIRPVNMTAEEMRQLIDQLKEDGSSSSSGRKSSSSRRSSGRRRR